LPGALSAPENRGYINRFLQQRAPNRLDVTERGSGHAEDQESYTAAICAGVRSWAIGLHNRQGVGIGLIPAAL